MEQKPTQEEEEFAEVLFMHFPHLASSKSQREFDRRVRRIKCGDCMDFKMRVCHGEGRKREQVLECMAQKTFIGEGTIGMDEETEHTLH